MVFGTPYFRMGIKAAGVIGWTIGFIFRVTILIGFLNVSDGARLARE